ncbi:glutathione S-transferase family protein [Pragia fontium]|uniref:glutathione S-transferase family protein n=1 Tax=Pragia fontium TaxID=82985 RepID=UPI0006495D9E|nr:glutathione S-transferase family protein [Pragia fontium]AKJ42483.1 glutathione S-transferase [Pragia fontium]
MTSDKVHILGPQFSTFVRSVQLCCEEKGIAYTVGTTIDQQTVSLNDGSLFQFHPFGKVPVLIHHGKRFFETTAICRYLDNCFDGVALQPDTAEAKAEVDEWSNCLAIYVDRALVRDYLLEFAFPRGPEGQIRKQEIKAAEPQVLKVLGLLDTELGSKPFFKGDNFTIADAILIPMLDYLQRLPHAEQLFSGLQYLPGYLQRMRDRASAKTVLI